MRNTDETFGDLAVLRAKMMTWARRMTRGAHHAEDLVQSALVKMLANRHRAPAAFAEIDPWAYVILLNEFRSGMRVRREFVPLDDVPLAAADNPFTAVYCRQVCALLGIDGAMLLADPETPMTNTERVRRHRTRQCLLQVAA